MSHTEARELVDIVFLLHDFFDDMDKTAKWLTVQNPHFGGIKPIDLVLTGRGHKVLKFIRAAKEENLP